MAIIYNGNASIGNLTLIRDNGGTATGFTVSSDGAFDVTLHIQATSWGTGKLKVMAKNDNSLLQAIDFSNGGYTENKIVEMFCRAGVVYSFQVETGAITGLIIDVVGKTLQFI